MAENLTVISAPAREWRFQLVGDERVWSLPLMGSLPIATARKLAKMVDIATEVEMIDAACDLFDEVCPGLIAAVTADQLTEILWGWREASGVEPGESPASSD